MKSVFLDDNKLKTKVDQLKKNSSEHTRNRSYYTSKLYPAILISALLLIGGGFWVLVGYIIWYFAIKI